MDRTVGTNAVSNDERTGTKAVSSDERKLSSEQ
jgi:hypothetical protein